MKFIYTLILAILIAPSFAQKKGDLNLSDSEKENYEEAENYYKTGDCRSALPLYQELEEAHPEDISLKYKIGTCYVISNFQLSEAVTRLEFVAKADPDYKELRYYLPRAYHLNYQLDKAETGYNDYLKNPDKSRVADVKKFIQSCKNAAELMKKPVNIVATNIGDSINTFYSEYFPVFHSDDNRLFYTFRGDSSAINNRNEGQEIHPLSDYFELIFFTELLANGKWTVPKAAASPLNTGSTNSSLSTGTTTGRMILYRNNAKGTNGELFMLEKEGDKWSKVSPLTGINSKYNESSATFSGDGKTIFFSSDRPGGLGGRDIYRYNLNDDGSWSAPENLGVGINSPENEDAPFVSADGKKLYFSSAGHNTMGGYDIFVSELDGDRFESSYNIGYPVNTVNDEISLSVTADGKTAFYASDKSGGLGSFDIYTFKTAGLQQLVSSVDVSGTVTVNSKPIDAVIRVTDSQNKLVAIYNANAKDGKYTFNLLTGNDYKLNYENYQYPPVVKELSLPTDSKDQIIDADLTPPIVASNEVKQDTSKPVTAIAQTETKPATEKPAEVAANVSKPGETKPATEKPGEVAVNVTKPGETKPATEKPGEVAANVTKPGETKPGETKPSTTKESTTAATTKTETGVASTSAKPIPSAVPESQVILIKRLYFDYAKNNIQLQYKANLDDIAKAMKKTKQLKIEIIDCINGISNIIR